MGLRFFGRVLHFDSSGKNLWVRDAKLDSLGDERERLVSHSGEGLALFRGECRTDRQLALDLREMTLRGFQRGGVVGRCVGCCLWHIAFRVVNASRIPGSIRNRWWLGSENSLRYTQRALSNKRTVFCPTPVFFSVSHRSPAFDISHNLLTAARGRGEVCPDSACRWEKVRATGTTECLGHVRGRLPECSPKGERAGASESNDPIKLGLAEKTEKPEKPNKPLRLMREQCESPPLG